ncbi:MAG: carboxymuconolactone decarboxylase family protein [Bacteroidota bacterium]|nr:carboxymuconolactone decarboxylase family protein [Bacteroidota bacterium]
MKTIKRKEFVMRLNWVKVIPETYTAMKAMESFLERSKLETKLKELVKLRTSQINCSEYCVELHKKEVLASGESSERIESLADWRNSFLYTPRERAALNWCESLTLIAQSGAPDAIYEEVERLFTPEEIVELTFVIITMNAWNRLSVGFRTEVGNYALPRYR